MTIRELTQYQRKILNSHRICPVCNKEIFDFEDFMMLKIRHKRKVYYHFIHGRCNDGANKLIWPVEGYSQEDGYPTVWCKV